VLDSSAQRFGSDALPGKSTGSVAPSDTPLIVRMVPDHGCAVSWQRHSAVKLGSLIWIEDANQGWACSSCRWRFPVPTLLTGEDAKRAFDRLAAVKFRRLIFSSVCHSC
jgi:hypothetical protein